MIEEQITETIAPEDLADWHAALEQLRAADAVVRWEQMRLRRRYRISGNDQITEGGAILRGAEDRVPSAEEDPS